MPELPEVETSKEYLKPFLLNAKIINIQSNVPKLRWNINPEIENFFNNTIILKINRIGKYILINTSNKNTIILHLGMSGYLSIKEENIKTIGEDQFKLLEKRIFLQILDQGWKNHIQYLEQLRQVIGLRSYGNRDPLVEYKKEAFYLFEDLLYKIKSLKFYKKHS